MSLYHQCILCVLLVSEINLDMRLLGNSFHVIRKISLIVALRGHPRLDIWRHVHFIVVQDFYCIALIILIICNPRN